MEIKGKINLFVKKEAGKGKDGKDIINITGSIGVDVSKVKDEHAYRNLSYDVRLTGDLAKKVKDLKENTCYVTNVEKGFITARGWTDKDGNEHIIPVIAIQEASIEKAVAFTPKEATKENLKKAKANAKAIADSDLPF